MVSKIGWDDLVISYLVASIGYVLEPFPKHEFKPYGWHILATLHVCANVHATKHNDKKCYDIMSTYMVSIVIAFEKEEAKIN